MRGDILSSLRWASVIGLGILMIISLGLGWLVSGRAVRPVRSITEAARRASELQLGQRLALTGPDDEVTLSKPRRTPEQLEDMAAQVKRSVERAEATVEALLTLATSELGPATQEAIDLATAAEDALDAMRGAINQRQITVDAALEPAFTRGDRVLLVRMIANLVENAVRHNNPGGWIGIRTTRQADTAVLEVANTGPNIPAEQIPALFEPFARTKQRLNHAEGVGLEISVTIPTSPS